MHWQAGHLCCVCLPWPACTALATGHLSPGLLPPAHPPSCLQLGRRLCILLDAHQQRYTFSPLGALRWKRDLSEYAALAARLRSPIVRRHLEDMQARVQSQCALCAVRVCAE